MELGGFGLVEIPKDTPGWLDLLTPLLTRTGENGSSFLLVLEYGLLFLWTFCSNLALVHFGTAWARLRAPFGVGIGVGVWVAMGCLTRIV